MFTVRSCNKFSDMPTLVYQWIFGFASLLFVILGGDGRMIISKQVARAEGEEGRGRTGFATSRLWGTGTTP